MSLSTSSTGLATYINDSNFQAEPYQWCTVFRGIFDGGSEFTIKHGERKGRVPLVLITNEKYMGLAEYMQVPDLERVTICDIRGSKLNSSSFKFIDEVMDVHAPNSMKEFLKAAAELGSASGEQHFNTVYSHLAHTVDNVCPRQLGTISGLCAALLTLARHYPEVMNETSILSFAAALAEHNTKQAKTIAIDDPQKKVCHLLLHIVKHGSFRCSLVYFCRSLIHLIQC